VGSVREDKRCIGCVESKGGYYESRLCRPPTLPEQWAVGQALELGGASFGVLFFKGAALIWSFCWSRVLSARRIGLFDP
jgi:hypothetical protein